MSNQVFIASQSINASKVKRRVLHLKSAMFGLQVGGLRGSGCECKQLHEVWSASCLQAAPGQEGPIDIKALGISFH